jgi:hypothetical protein
MASRSDSPDAVQVTEGVKYAQAECTWLIEDFSVRFPVAQSAENQRRGNENFEFDLEHLLVGYENDEDGRGILLLVELSRSLEVEVKPLKNDLNGIIKLSFDNPPAHQVFGVVVCIMDANGKRCLETVVDSVSSTYVDKADNTPCTFKRGKWSSNRKKLRIAYDFSLPYEEIVAKKNLYLPSDTLRLRITVGSNELKHGLSHMCLTSLSNDMSELMSSGLKADFEIHCGNGRLPVHQAILAARSPYFAALLSHDMKEKNLGFVRQEEFDEEIMKAVIDFMYSSKIDVNELGYDKVCKIAQAADKYQLGQLKHICFNYLANKLSLETAGHVAIIAYLHSAPPNIRKRIYEFCGQNWCELGGNPAFQVNHAKWPKAFHKPSFH